MLKYLHYFWYVIRHKYYVLIECFKSGLIFRGLLHDLDKFKPKAFIAYARYFYGERTEKVKKEFSYQWLHHQKNNKHHWEYWVLVCSREKEQVLEMPTVYAEEMLCDWKGAGKARGAGPVLNWYLENRHKMKLHANTTKYLEESLDLDSVARI